MVPFKPYFLGQQAPLWDRATSVQKCVRTGDIEEVGKTSRHGTFFQMNGNFSFGDYFKEGAIQFAWELITTPQGQGGYGLDADKIWPTVYEDDDEAYDLWHRMIGIPAERITRRGKLDNYWHMGVPGPGGPCSELYLDRGPEYGREGGPAVDEDRYLEFWNLVFMQYELSAVRAKDDFDIAGELPKKNIDTGMGLERMATLLQGVDNLYEIDEVYPVLDRAAELTGKKYGAHSGHAASESHPDDVRLRVVADHVRSCLMLIGDGVTPGNEGRGYVLRRMLRRAVRSMRLLGYDEPSLPLLLPVSRGADEELLPRARGRLRPDLPDRVCRGGGVPSHPRLGHDHPRHRGRPRTKSPGRQRRSRATQAFAAARHLRLPDRPDPGDGVRAGARGRPRGLHPADAGAAQPRQGRREGQEGRPRQHRGLEGPARARRDRLAGLPGADHRREGPRHRRRRRSGSRSSSPASAARSCSTAPRSTPSPVARSPTRASSPPTARTSRSSTSSARSRAWSRTPSRCSPVRCGSGQEVSAEVDADWRISACQAHSGTHVVHAALRQVLGPTALQSGSYNKPGYLRLDFAWGQGLSPETRSEIEEVANLAVRQDLPVSAQYMTLPEAREFGALALFGETYDEQVRVIEIGGPWSRELCGGTHVGHSSQIGALTVTGESSVGSGVRRLEAFVGMEALRYLAKERALVAELTDIVKVQPGELKERVAALVARVRDAERELEKLRREQVQAATGKLVEYAHDVDGVRVLTHDAGDGTTADDLRTMVLDLRNRLGDAAPSVVALTGVRQRPPGHRRGHQRRGPRPRHQGRRARAARGPDPRRRRRRQGRPRPGRRHRPQPHRRGPRPGRPRSAGGQPGRWVNQPTPTPMPTRPGRRVGIDVGSVRVGRRRERPVRPAGHPRADRGPRTRDEAASAAPTRPRGGRRRRRRAGRPSRSSSGCRGHSRVTKVPPREAARTYAGRLSERIAPVPVRLVDERLTTVDAHRNLRESGVDGRRQRAVVDQAAAVLILQTALDAERSSGRPPGELVRTGGRKPRTKDRRR